MVAVPVDGGGEAGAEVEVGGGPAEFGAQAGGVDGVAAVVAGAVGDEVESVGGLVEEFEDGFHDGAVVDLAVGADEVGLADLAAVDDGPHGVVVVVDVDPVPDVAAVAVELGSHPGEHVGDLAGDELLDVLVRAVVVGAVGDGGGHAEGADPGAHEQVAAGFGRGVGARRVVGGLFGEAGGVVEIEVAVDLVGADVVVAHLVGADGFEQGVGAHEVGGDERRRVGQGVVVVGFGGEVHDEVCFGDESADQGGVGDVAFDEFDAVGDRGEGVGVGGVGEFVQDPDRDVGAGRQGAQHEVGADEPGTPGHENTHARRLSSRSMVAVTLPSS